MVAIFRSVVIAGMAVGLVACATPESQQARMKRLLDGAVGHSVAEYVAYKGYPTDSVDLSKTEKSFRWVMRATGNGAVVPIGGSFIVAPPRELVCTVILRAYSDAQNPTLADWKIMGWDWNGNC
jgi:hypothetical protein